MIDTKYRAWDKRYKVMREVISLNFHTCRMAYWGENEEYLHIDFCDIKLLQYIGRQDINKKDIYEGDFTNHGTVEYNNQLSWDSGGSVHPGFYFKGASCWGKNDLEYHTGFDDCEVLGNIYENPELSE